MTKAHIHKPINNVGHIESPILLTAAFLPTNVNILPWPFEASLTASVAIAMSIRSIVVLLGALWGACVAAREQYILNPTTVAPSPTALARAHGYSHIGCWNETVGLRGNEGVRALAGGKNVRLGDYDVVPCSGSI